MIERDTDGGPATQIVEHTYDYLNRWVARAVDSDGDGPLDFVDTYFVYDGVPSGAVSLDRAAVTLDTIGQIVLQFDDDAQGDPQLTHRYLWGAAVDQILADEQVTDPALEGDVLWALTDQLGTVRDLAQYDPATDTTTIGNHRTFDSFGNLLTETNPALDHLFAFTGRALDTSTSLQNNLNRWYDTAIGQWVSEDPIGFAGGDTNVRRYVVNGPLHGVDPSGLAWYNPLSWPKAIGEGFYHLLFGWGENEAGTATQQAATARRRALTEAGGGSAVRRSLQFGGKLPGDMLDHAGRSAVEIAFTLGIPGPADDYLKNAYYYSKTTKGVSRAALIKALAKAGIKHNADDIIHIATRADGALIFLEKGNAKAGLLHILARHADDFVKAGIPREQIADAVFQAATKGTKIGMQGDRPIYEVMFNGTRIRVAVTVGDNGFIVGANPVHF